MRQTMDWMKKHIEYYRYIRDKSKNQISKGDLDKLQKFYKELNLDSTLLGQPHTVIYKRTVNFIYVISHYYGKKKNAILRRRSGKYKGIGVVRTKSYLFYKNGKILFESDHDYCREDNNLVKNKILKKNYELYQELNNSYLNSILNNKDFFNINRSCELLLTTDDMLKSVDFLKGD